MKFKNELTGAILSEREYNELLEREYTEMWKQNDDLIVSEFKEEGKTLKDFIKYMIENNIDTDFKIVEE